MTYNLPSESPGAFALAPCVEGAAPFLRIGGAPHLPNTLEWPKGCDGQLLHFFGAFDFAKMPKTFGGTKQSPMPETPAKGIGLIFLNMFARADDQLEVVILRSETSDDVTLDGAVPDALQPMLPPSEYLDRARLSECGRMFLRSDHVLTPMASTKRPRAPKAPEFQSLSVAFKAVLDGSSATLDQARSFRLSEDIVGCFHGITRNELHNWAIKGVSTRDLKFLEGLLTKKRERARQISINDPAPFMDRILYANAKLPEPKDLLDDLFISWMRYVRVNCERQAASENLTDREMAWFRAACDRIVKLENDTSPPQLRCLARMRNHDVTGADIADHMREIITRRVARAIEIAAIESSEPLVFPTFKVFGRSDGTEPAAWDDGEHILLFQFADAFGPNFLKIDSLLQVWIRPEDLAQGMFDRICIALEFAR